MIRRLISHSFKMDSRRKKVQNFSGPIAAVFTPFSPTGSLNLDVIGPYAKYLQENTIKGIYVTGTTGEFLQLTLDERKKVIKKWLDEGKNRMELIIVHISTSCMAETKELAKYAAEKNADCIAVLPPLYYVPNNDNELIQYLKEISECAPEIPLMYYHIPKMSGYNFRIDDVFPKILKAVPTFVGAKYTSNDLHDAVQCLAKYGDQFKIMLGSDPLQLNGLISGMNACVLASANAFPSLSVAIHDAYKNRDIDKALKNQNKLILATNAITDQGEFYPAYKQAMSLLSSIDVGPTRSPLIAISDISKFKEEISKINFESE